MKMKFVRNGKTKRRELVVASQRGELLDVRRASQLAEDLSTVLLLGYSFETQRGGSGSLQHYDVEGLWSLRTYLSKRAMGVGELMGLLQATQQVLDVCTEKRLPAEGLLFDPEYVFVDAQCRPHFALMLLTGVPFQARNSPLALLRALGEGRGLRYATPEAGDLSKRIGDFAEDQNGVFSANNYRRFLDVEEQAMGVASGLGVGEGGEVPTGSVWTSAGLSQDAEGQDGSSFFWSPLAGMTEESAPQEEPSVARPEPGAYPQEHTPAATPVMPAPVSVQVVPVVPVAKPEPTVVAPAPEPSLAPVSTAPTAAPPSVARPMRACFVRQTTQEEYPLPVGHPVKVGRGSACDIQLRGNPRLSRIHAQLVWDGERIQVSDLGAANGTWVNGTRLLPQQTTVLVPGQSLRLANEDCIVRVE